jgi:transposase-like protein
MVDKRQESEARKQRQNRYFSDSFKKQKVRELERNLTSVAEISREYEVSGTAIYKWIYKYSAMMKKGIKQVVEPMSDTQKIKELRERIKELERAVGQKQMLLDFKDKMIDTAEELYGVDIKKKLGLPPSAGSGSTGKNTPGK